MLLLSGLISLGMRVRKVELTDPIPAFSPLRTPYFLNVVEEILFLELNKFLEDINLKPIWSSSGLLSKTALRTFCSVTGKEGY